MTTETLTFSKARLARLKDEYASAKAEGREEFEFDGYTFLIGYAKYLIRLLSPLGVQVFSRNIFP